MTTLSPCASDGFPCFPHGSQGEANEVQPPVQATPDAPMASAAPADVAPPDAPADAPMAPAMPKQPAVPPQVETVAPPVEPVPPELVPQVVEPLQPQEAVPVEKEQEVPEIKITSEKGSQKAQQKPEESEEASWLRPKIVEMSNGMFLMFWVEFSANREIVITDPEGQNVAPVAFETFDACPFPEEIKEEVTQGIDLVIEVKRSGFVKPSPIQMYSWPLAVQGKDIIGIATTGSGKTVAFLFPAFGNLGEGWSRHIMETKAKADDPVLLCLSPTRELAVQVENEAHKFGKHCGIVTVCVYGGVGNKRASAGFLGGSSHDLTVMDSGFLMAMVGYVTVADGSEWGCHLYISVYPYATNTFR
eukprot:Skav228515  [mRNA]  locus=scaffold3621:84964:94056:- [translate_table: standard]